MITLYHLNISRSERIIWLLEELGLEYRIEPYPREKSGAAPESMVQVHAMGRAPIIRDGDTVLAESGAIVEYLVNRHGGGRLGVPPGDARYPRYLYWMHFSEGSLMTVMLIALTLSRIPEAAESAVKKRVWDRLHKVLAFVDAELGAGPWFLGEEFSAADVMMTFPFTTTREYLKYDLAPYANLAAFVARVEARPAYRKAMELK
jgi:glutathione S-transferase